MNEQNSTLDDWRKVSLWMYSSRHYTTYGEMRVRVPTRQDDLGQNRSRHCRPGII